MSKWTQVRRKIVKVTENAWPDFRFTVVMACGHRIDQQQKPAKTRRCVICEAEHEGNKKIIAGRRD